MKRITQIVVILTLTLALLLAQAASAEPSEAVKGVFDAMVAEGSAYSDNKAMYTEYFPDVTYEEALLGDGFTITASGSEYVDGSWTFTRDGDYLTTTLASDDYNGVSLVVMAINALGNYYGMDTDLVSGYVNGLDATGVESDCFYTTRDDAAGTVTYWINIAGPWEMAELDQMVLDERSIYSGALTEDYTSSITSVGKLRVVANGSVDDVTILLGEHGGLDDLAYRSIINVVGVFQPKGWEAFVANYTELTDAEADGYSVQLDVGLDAAGEIFDDVSDHFAYAIIRFGA